MDKQNNSNIGGQGGFNQGQNKDSKIGGQGIGKDQMNKGQKTWNPQGGNQGGATGGQGRQGGRDEERR